jgi:L-asparaginase / beta-aspartyl-peptidase
LLFACPALAYSGEKLTKDARVSIAEARADGRNSTLARSPACAASGNPVLLALVVMEKSEHIFLIGEGAGRFAQKHGIKTLTIS